MTSPQGVSDLRNKLLTSEFHQILLSPLIHDIQRWTLFTQFVDNDVTKEINIPEFEELTKKIGFHFLNKYSLFPPIFIMTD